MESLYRKYRPLTFESVVGQQHIVSTLEQLSVFGDGSVRIDDARALLGEVASTVLSEFACKMAVRDTVGHGVAL